MVLCLVMAFTKGSTECITMSFAAYEDGECLATIDLYSNCTFRYVNMEETPFIRINGTYEMEDGPIERGCQKRIYISTNEGSAKGDLVWPLQEELTLLLGEFIFRRVK